MKIVYIISFVLIIFNIQVHAKTYKKEIADWTFIYNDTGEPLKRHLKIISTNYNDEYNVGPFMATFPIFLKQFPLELGGYDGSISPTNEDEHIDGSDVFMSDSEIPTFKIDGKEGTFFGLFETSAGASGGGGYRITLVNVDDGTTTRFAQGSWGDFSIIRDNNEIIAIITYDYERILGWSGTYPLEVVLWGNLSQKHDVDTKLSLLKAHFEKEHEVLKPFSQKEMTFLLNYQNTLTCDSYDCWNHNIPTDLYSSVRKEAFRILKKAILKVIYEDKFSKKIIPDELNFMKIVSLMTLNYNYNGTDLHEINNDFQNGNLKEISHYFTFDFNPNKDLCVYATANIIKNKKWVKIWETHPDYQEHVKKAKNLGLTCDVGS